MTTGQYNHPNTRCGKCNEVSEEASDSYTTEQIMYKIYFPLVEGGTRDERPDPISFIFRLI